MVNLVQGGRLISEALSKHESISGILFTGSYNAGKAIKQATIDQPWKLLALEMGGKNSAIIWEDADMETALYETITGAFLTSGQRCSATGKNLFIGNYLMNLLIDSYNLATILWSVIQWSQFSWAQLLIYRLKIRSLQTVNNVAKNDFRKIFENDSAQT